MPDNNLPEWDLTDIYPAPDSAEIEVDFQRAVILSKDFAKRYRGNLANINGDEMGQAIGDFEVITEILYKAMSYAQLLYAADVSDGECGRFYQTTQERVTDISGETLFFQLELNRLDDDVLGKQLESKGAARYASWIRDVRAFRDYQLSDELEKLLHEKSVSGRAAWIRLFDETEAGLRFSLDGKELGMSDVLNQLSDTDAKQRKKAAKVLGQVLRENVKLFSLVTNTMAKDKATEDTWRSYPRPISERNLSNQVEDHVVDALVTSVKDAYPSLSHRYYRLKSKWFGVDALDYWDRNAPLPNDEGHNYSWDDARKIVLNAYDGFDHKMANVAEQFFKNNWIDARLRAGKSSGAFSHSTVPSVHPYILMNFQGKARDVTTLAHELGHGIHQVMSAPQGALMADTPLTTAETASVFGEMLTFRSMLDVEDNPVRRRILLAGKVEDMLNTVVRQIAFHTFETRVHDERKLGELSSERLCDIWMEVQSESLGDGVRFDDDYRSYWAYISHFIHMPFYVYAYAFGDCLVNSLYDVFQGGHKGFQEKYIDMLSAGGTRRHKELLAPFGLDASDPEFWNRGLGVVSGFVDELEQSAFE
jgi:oligoendopeptidase F